MHGFQTKRCQLFEYCPLMPSVPYTYTVCETNGAHAPRQIRPTMRLIHNSRLSEYRFPFGALELSDSVTLRLRAEDADGTVASVQARTWIDEIGEELYPMVEDAQDEGLYACTLSWDEPGIVWYSFIVTLEDGTQLRVGAPEGRVGGEGVTYDYEEVPSFQLTVYLHRATRPTWYENGMVYQIFPDRYARDDAWRERTEAALSKPHNGTARRIIEDWTTPPLYARNPDNSIACWNFYGGSLKGIENDLPRLHELGFTAIYLNPIFQAESSHRYDTGDYLKIDPVLGTDQDFRDLCDAAEKLGISIILDGVFNHTGDDSRYFNKYGNYPGVGAYQSEDSPWRDAYNFHEDGTYDSWWGIGNMPALNEDSELVQERLLGTDGVIRHWLRQGAHGWRLDVADELTDDMIEKIKTATLAEREDGLVLGEVWEDASNKVSYSKLRRYLLGSELDSAMNYPFRDLVLNLLMGWGSAADAAEAIETLSENYPPEALHCALNLLSSHDRPRIVSVLGGAPLDDSVSEAERSTHRLSPDNMNLAKGRFWLATLMQMTFPGVPSIYYGDEFGLEGLTDPGNRRTLPRKEDPRDYDFETMIKNASAIRRALPFMVTGSIHAWALNDDVLAYTRRDDETGEVATVLINRSTSFSHSVRIPALKTCATDVISGHELEPNERGEVQVDLYPLGSSIVYFHEERRLQHPLRTGAGVICHITSVPRVTGTGAGTIGADTDRFIEHLSDLGMQYWQLLPVNPTDSFGSPYAGPSAFAGNTNLLPESDEELQDAYRRWVSLGGAESDARYEKFAQENESWLNTYCTFMAVKKRFGGVSRHEWPERYRTYSPELERDPDLADEAAYQAYLQYRFDVAWTRLKEHAHDHGLQIIGDIPMYVSDDSADAWSHPEFFWLSDTGSAIEIAGAPPDNMSADGQVWGNPTFRWDVMKQDGYSWWLARLERAFHLYDRVRLDHFLGFHAYYSIPAGKPCADGRWLAGPGKDLFQAAYDKFGPLHFVAEDLGYLTPGVRALSATCGFPGMDVLLFSDYDIRGGVHPEPGKILYTSTHDTQTLVGFCQDHLVDGHDSAAAHELAGKLIDDALESESELVMMPLQDVLDLDDDARMNVPGVAEGNWAWQADEKDIVAAIEPFAERMRKSGRFHK